VFDHPTFGPCALTQVNAAIRCACESFAWWVNVADPNEREEDPMSMLKVIEVLAESPHGFDEAVQAAVTMASETVREIKSVYIKEMSALVENGKITSYRVNAKISFVVEK
jgi:dodecin